MVGREAYLSASLHRFSTNIRYIGAPECCNTTDLADCSLQIKPKVDIWSFGCILSEAAVWLSCNYEQLQQYRKERSKDPSDDSFHDGEKVLGTVINWHDKVRGAESKSDNFTSRVLETIEKEMLLQDPDSRSDPGTIWSRAKYLRPGSLSANTAIMLLTSPEAYSQSDRTIRHQEAPPPPSPVLQNGVISNTPSGREMARVYPLTHQYLQECNATIDSVEKVGVRYRHR
jgi:hypothetical protein